MRRRNFIKGIVGSTLAWPLAASAQKAAMPVIGFINSDSPEGHAQQLAAFLDGLSETGYIEGRNKCQVHRGNATKYPNGHFGGLFIYFLHFAPKTS
jgi:hypothetical protein